MTKSRKIWLDVVRATAILCVVLCHSVEAFYHPVLLGQLQVSFPLWNIENLLFTVGRIGVPLFLATTGALMLPRDYPDVSAFYKKSLLPLFLTTEIWIFCNYIFYCLIEHKAFDVSRLILEMLFLKVSSLSHMWYMPVILGCYVALPFISRLLQASTNLRQYSLLYILGIVIFFMIPTANVFFKEAITVMPGLSPQFDTGLWGSCYSFYIITGYLISKHQLLDRFKSQSLLFGIILAFVLNSTGQYYLYSHHYYQSTWLYWYTDFAIFLIGIFTFELLRRRYHHKTIIKFAPVIEYISRCSFGVYIIHKPILVVLQKCFNHFTTAPVRIQMPALFFASLFSSLILLYPFKSVWKKAGSLLFHIK